MQLENLPMGACVLVARGRRQRDIAQGFASTRKRRAEVSDNAEQKDRAVAVLRALSIPFASAGGIISSSILSNRSIFFGLTAKVVGNL
jgi:hypothetical protein